MNSLRRRWGLRIALTLCGAIAASAFVAYRADLRRAIQRISSGSVLASTPCGQIEYAVRGRGPPVLVVHGAGGGFDQGMLLGRELAARGYRAIAVSRFGYLRTPLPLDASPEAQADAHACLMEALGIDRAGVIGVSAGAPSAMQFAIRHRQRCSALVLLVPLAWHPEQPGETSEAPSQAMRLALWGLEHDFVYWLLIRFFPRLVTSTLLATPPELLESASRGERERIQARTLSISLEDDLFETYPGARYTASRIHGARFVGFPSGGHVWVGHHSEIIAAIADFLHTSQPERTVFNRNALPTTDTEDRLIATAASIGLMSQPKAGYRSPAATGTPSAL
jgi:pimeloyl-ACP methyl ester carboxylesterase